MATVMATVGPTAVRLSAKPQCSNRLAMKSSTLNSELGFLTAQFCGIKLSPIQLQTNSPSPISAPLRPSLQIVARKVCPFTKKKTNRGNKVSHSKHTTTKLQCVNLQTKRIWWEAGKRWVKLRLSTRALRIIEKNGLDETAMEAGIDLRKK